MHVRKLVAAASAIVLSLAVAACGGGGGGTTATTSAGAGQAPAGGAGTLVIWTDDKRAPAIKQFADQFASENGITASVEVIAKELQTQFITASQAGKAPDVVIGAHDWIGNLVQNGTIDPIQLTDSVKAQFDPLAIKAVTFNSQIYGVPFTIANVVLFRNTDLAPTAPATIEEMVAKGKELKAAGSVTEIFALPVGPNGDAYHINPLYTSAGGYMFGQTASGDYDPKDFGLAKPEAVAAYQKIRALGEQGEGALKRSISTDNLLSLFTGKKTAFMVSGPWQFAELKKATDLKWDITPVPGFAGMKPAQPFITVDAVYVASKGKNKALAQEFATNYLTKPNAALALAQADPRPPALKAALDQMKASDPNQQKVVDAGKAGVIMPAIPAMAALWDPLGKAEAAVVGGADPQATINAAAAAIQPQLK
jgi:arabinogalactan oligomer / maltooligosaccharide transport system substrate-binding protein